MRSYVCTHCQGSSVVDAFCGGSNEEISWLGLESMHVASKLAIFPGLSLQEEQLLFLPVLSATYAVRRNRMGHRDRWILVYYTE
jgi:hypothetical protein